MALLDELASTVASVGERVGPAVVGIGNGWRGGSGVVIGQGRVLTNAHNIRGDGATVLFADGRRAAGQVVAADADGDVAILAVDTGSATVIEWRGDATPALGSPVFALSNPPGQGLRVTFGLVSGLDRAFSGPRGRRITGSIEHTAPLAPGSSGGPIVDSEGRLLGLNTLRLGNGFYLALPADAALRSRADALGRGEVPERRRLGIGLAPGHVARRMRRAVGLPEQDGLLVRSVEEDGPAGRAGIREGDFIVAADGAPLRTLDDLQAALDRPDASSLELRVMRGTEERAVSISWTNGGQDATQSF